MDLLGYIGIRTFVAGGGSNALNRPSVSQSDINRGLAAINAALQQIYEKGPTEFKQDRRSATMYAPTAVTLTINSPNEVTMTAGKEEWMTGCTIQIQGDPYQNEIVGFSNNDVSLLRAHSLSAGIGLPATVYCDAVLLASDVKAVMEPVEIPPNRRLTPANSRADFDRFSFHAGSGPYAGAHGLPVTSLSKSVGTPGIYWVEPYYSLVEDYLPLYIRVNPMPNGPMSLLFRVEHKAERVTEEIYDSTDNDPNYQFTSVPADQVERILLPVARYHFAAHPSFKNRESRAAINDQYKEVMESLTLGGSNFSPSRRRNFARYK